MALTADTISKKHKQDLKQLRRLRGDFFARAVVIGAVALLLLFVFALLWGQGGESREFGLARQMLALTGSDWSQELIERQAEYRDWLGSYAFGFDARCFERFSSLMFRSAASIGGERLNLSFLARSLVALHFAVLRIVFILLACWKLWLIVVAVAAYRARSYWRAYEAEDLLGQTGNGRVFYSGIRAALENLDETGRPNAQVVGLACPPRVSEEQAKKSGLVAVLDRYGASNETNRTLAAIILQFPQHKPYVAERDEHSKLEQVFRGGALAENATKLLEQLLELHHEYQLEKYGGPEAPGPGESFFDTQRYAEALTYSAHRVLTPELRMELGSLPPASVATFILALEAGKVMAFGYEGEKWVRKSNFPQLSARAVLHSIAAFAREYQTEERSTIRRALVYGSRRSAFAPVRLPVDLSNACRAARSWVELLLACPHELASVTDELELLALVTEAHSAWEELFFQAVSAQRSSLVDGAFSTPSNLALFPLRSVLGVLRESLKPEVLKRLEVLVSAVSQRQRLEALADDRSNEDGEKYSRAVREHVVAPLSFGEIKELQRVHEVSPEDLRDWSSLRVVLQMFGWLARRVGDYTVPSSSLILAALKLEEPNAGCNQLGLLACRGLVPLRATRIFDRYGKQWTFKLVRAARAKMAMHAEQLERLMQGLDQEEPEDEESNSAPGAPPGGAGPR